MEFLVGLQQAPAGVGETAEVIAGFDQCFVAGFASLDGRQHQALAALARALAGTPLAGPLAESLQAFGRNEFLDHHFAALARARAALQGAQFDALQQQVWAALGRRPLAEVPPASEAAELPDHALTWLASARRWLVELVLAGFARLEARSLTPFMATLAQMQGESQLVRPAALLTGFFDELMRAVPVADPAGIPLYRWVDLWSRAMVTTFPLPQPGPVELVSSDLYLLGLDVRQHDHFISLVAYGLLAGEKGARAGRLTLSAYKVDAVQNEEVWLLFPRAALLFDALAQRRVLRLSQVPCWPAGDLRWDGERTAGGHYDPMSVAARWFSPGAAETAAPLQLPPADRHPLQLAEPVFLEGYAAGGQGGEWVLDWGGGRALPVAMDRVSPLTGLTKEAVAHSTRLFGLLRFDAGRWSVQPLALTSQQGEGRPRTLVAGEEAAAVLRQSPKNSAVATLQERAGRLLRAG
ncbi:MAG: hypothetical protein L0332_29560 [Chloroflexi bacterium]|nr:hypothetical protein [Chloroflexota bacterium]MCI0578910.1 hypothetical protein [Chloroflexota bacterium]MCI0647537.1 hypothetical protein [Chloroflexota bacterium]MCI0730848.1 hypothetical protein [Chloroflexota bacterium]